MEPSLREGAARLSFETGALLVPVTIAGAYRAWPHFKALPSPARIRVRFHAPIDPAPFQALPEDEALPAMLVELRRRVDRSLLPGVKADLRMNVLYGSPAPAPRLVECAAALVVALTLLATRAGVQALWPSALYLGYLVFDWQRLPQSRMTKRVRNASAAVFLAAVLPLLVRRLGGPEIAAGAALFAVLAGALFPYLYERGRTATRFFQGLALALLMEGGALLRWPSPIGPHVALPLFAALFAFSRHTVFSRYAAPILAAYAVGIPLLLGGGRAVLPHVGVAFLAWAAVALRGQRFSR